jgi:YggT family protein
LARARRNHAWEFLVGEILLTTSQLFFTALQLLILARVILSYLPQYRYSQFGEFVYNITEPVLRPFQRVIPPMGMLDISPMVAIITLIIAQAILEQIIRTVFYL